MSRSSCIKPHIIYLPAKYCTLADNVSPRIVLCTGSIKDTWCLVGCITPSNSSIYSSFFEVSLFQFFRLYIIFKSNIVNTVVFRSYGQDGVSSRRCDTNAGMQSAIILYYTRHPMRGIPVLYTVHTKWSLVFCND